MRGRLAYETGMIAFVAVGSLLLLGLHVPPASATSPCMPTYRVDFADPAWTVTLTLREERSPLDRVWYWSPWNGRFESIAPHVGHPPTQVERVTFTDRDRDGNLSFNDALQVWDGNRSLANATIAIGAGPPAFDSQVNIHLEDGYVNGCGPLPPWWFILVLDPILLLLLILFIAVVVGLGLLLVRSHLRGQTPPP